VTKKIQAVYQGCFKNLDEIQVSPMSRAFLFSDSIYEVIPFQNRNLICADEHFKRLSFSASELKINLDVEKVKKEVDHLFKNSLCNDGYIYYQVSRGIDDMRSHLYSPDISNETFGYLTPIKFLSRPLKVAICEDIRWGRCDIKTTSLLGNVMQMNNFQDKNCDEIIMHRNNIITEGGASNIFFVRDKKICTSKLSKNILPGITRNILIKVIKENNLPFEEGDFSIDDLKQASSIWFTSSTKGLASVKEVLDCNIKLDQNDELLLTCQALYKAEIIN
jgi:D-alanine transaminase|tara:strand:- start:1563 stop:2393 length:831 start_codon:yes stop_codon:yes gene_type:complete